MEEIINIKTRRLNDYKITFTDTDTGTLYNERVKSNDISETSHPWSQSD